MSPEFLTALSLVIAAISALILGILKINKEKFKDRVDDGNVSRKEVSDLLKKLYEDTKGELDKLRETHSQEIKDMRAEHLVELRAATKEIDKRDIIISQIISLLPTEGQISVRQKMREIGLDI